MERIWITCNPDNIASRRTCERLGGAVARHGPDSKGPPLPHPRRNGKVPLPDRPDRHSPVTRTMHPPPSTPVAAQTLIDRFDEAGLLSLVLLGSHARGSGSAQRHRSSWHRASWRQARGEEPIRPDRRASRRRQPRRSRSRRAVVHVIRTSRSSPSADCAMRSHWSIVMTRSKAFASARSRLPGAMRFASVRPSGSAGRWSTGSKKCTKPSTGCATTMKENSWRRRHVLTWDLLQNCAGALRDSAARSDRDAFEATIRAVGEGSAWSSSVARCVRHGKTNTTRRATCRGPAAVRRHRRTGRPRPAKRT